MNGEYVAERSKDDKLAASDSQAARSSAGTAAASDPSDRIIVDREELHRITVSYTHLDVYKRQPITRRKLLKSSAFCP